MTCIACGKDLSDADVLGVCSDECYEKQYCHQPPPLPAFEKITMDELELVIHGA